MQLAENERMIWKGEHKNAITFHAVRIGKHTWKAKMWFRGCYVEVTSGHLKTSHDKALAAIKTGW